MPFTITAEPGEELLLHAVHAPSEKSEPFVLAISNRALFLPRKKMFAVSDPWYFQRVPLGDVRQIRVERIRPFALLVLAAVMIIAGGYATYAMLTGPVKSGWPVAIVVGGLMLPFVARGRVALVVVMREGNFRWKPPLVIGRVPRLEAMQLFDDIVGAARAAGVIVFDERSAPG